MGLNVLLCREFRFISEVPIWLDYHGKHMVIEQVRGVTGGGRTGRRDDGSVYCSLWLREEVGVSLTASALPRGRSRAS